MSDEEYQDLVDFIQTPTRLVGHSEVHNEECKRKLRELVESAYNEGYAEATNGVST